MTLLANGKVVTPDAVLDPGWIEVVNERIVGVGEGIPARPADVDLAGRIVVPGFVDTHVHGGGGASYLTATLEDTARVAEFHRSHGTTTTFASLVSTTAEELERQVVATADLVVDGVVAGMHLEGPWISEARKGAHDPACLRPAERAELDRLLALGRGTIRMVTLAPELPGGLDAVRRVCEAGVVAAVGHSDADYTTVIDAVDAGATVATHLFNGMPPLHHRAPGPVGALLEDERVTVELIADGMHVHPGVIAVAARSAGADRVSLVTDAMAAAGMPDGVYNLGHRPVRVENGLVMLISGESIAGSTLTMDAAFRLAVQQAGQTLTQAARMASTTPARTFGLTEVGALQAGLLADLVVLDSELGTAAVMRRGSWVSGELTKENL
ncbi:N-acetylglucosamine-6-phosphate deacetylase [Actinopolymorpha pittospori]|uniref:N-acetylglucosamine-6-phosphate deacetylase n=1 Tax=Actinopolymorpha pittospori TaxID=648752 RepID=A0A927RQL7_9ACTN|nr:N-acetylglucosamine-6-phosphate deacetylase [Actinopolymorpha pittospori]